MSYKIVNGINILDLFRFDLLFFDYPSLAEVSSKVDLGRIELPPAQCECAVIPLNYRPKLSQISIK
jgi:hypothetical protein